MRLIASLCAGSLLSAACGARGVEPRRPMELRRVILYQNGIGHFERAGHVTGETLRLSFARGELDDVLKTLTVIDRQGAAVATVDVPTVTAKTTTVDLGVRMSAGRVHDLKVSYAVPTPTWKAAYRVVMDEATRGGTSLLQGWALINNASQEDWRGVQLTLATGAPMSFVHDLHTPQYVKRPDVHGNLVAPVLGPIENERLGALDTDSDGITDHDDTCPDSSEDRDGFEDEDGCPDADNDRDRVLDLDDRCPNEPETYNGYEDGDGCPDRGRVVVTDSTIEVLDLVFFPRASAAVKQASSPILDAVAATLSGNPEIVKLEIGGHATSDEGDVWGLSLERASQVRQALVQRGVDPRRLVIVPYGATRPFDGRTTDAARDKNRRVDFLIAQRREASAALHAPTRNAPTRIDARTAQASVHTATRPAEVAGSVRYELSEPVTIRRGMSSMVSILNKPIGAHDVYLFRPDPKAPGSDRHPFRAVRLVNDSGFMLEPGPIAIFARGSFVGDSVIGRLAAGETAWIPYAIDGATSIRVVREDDDRPTRIVSIQRGVMTVEHTGVRTTRYTVEAGRDPAKQIFIRHARAEGHTATQLPPGTLDRGDAYLVPLPLQPGKPSVLALEERQPRRHTLQLLDAGATQLGLYVEGTRLPPEVADRLHRVIALRTELGSFEQTLEEHRTRLSDLAERSQELRDNLTVLAKVRGAEEVRKRLLASLAQVTAEADALARKLSLDSEALATARSKLQDALRDLTLGT